MIKHNDRRRAHLAPKRGFEYISVAVFASKLV